MTYEIIYFASAYRKNGNPFEEIDLPDGFANTNTLAVESGSFEQAREIARSKVAEQYKALGYNVNMSINNESVFVENSTEIGVEFYGFAKP